MHRLFLAGLVALAMTAPSLVGPAAADDAKLGQDLVAKFFGAVRSDDGKDAGPLIAEGYQSSNSAGAVDREAALKRIAGLKIEGAPVFTNWKVTREGPTVIVTYDLAISEVLDGKRTDGAPAPRMTVFLMTSKGWQVIAHANFKTAD